MSSLHQYIHYYHLPFITMSAKLLGKNYMMLTRCYNIALVREWSTYSYRIAVVLLIRHLFQSKLDVFVVLG